MPKKKEDSKETKKTTAKKRMPLASQDQEDKKSLNSVSPSKVSKSSKRVQKVEDKKGGNKGKKAVKDTPKVLPPQTPENGKNECKEKENVGYRKITDEQLEEDLMYFRGIIASICQKHKMTRAAVWKRINKSDHLQEVYKDSKELFKDEIENQFVKAVRRGDKWAIEKGIDKLLHDRGYINRQEIDQTVKTQDEETQKRKELLGNMSAAKLKEWRKLQKQQIDLLESVKNKDESERK